MKGAENGKKVYLHGIEHTECDEVGDGGVQPPEAPECP